MSHGPTADPTLPPAAKRAKSEAPAKGKWLDALTTEPGQSRPLPRPQSTQAARLTIGDGLRAATR